MTNSTEVAAQAAVPRLGIDIGGSGIKGAPVVVGSGELAAERFRIDTPQPAKVERVLPVIEQVAAHFEMSGPIGITFPGVIQHGVVRTAANMHPSWVGLDADAVLTERLGRPVSLVNDADAAGLAEMRYGVGKGRSGTVIMVTLGTGIGTAVFTDGVLVRNTELGHLELDGHDAEKRAAGAVREVEGLPWHDFAKRVQHYLRHVHALFWPELFILGGGVSKRAEKFVPHMDVPCEVVPASLQNNAGIVGAALVCG